MLMMLGTAFIVHVQQNYLARLHAACGALRASNGPEQAGQVARAALQVAGLRGVVDVHDAKALGVPIRPLKVVCAAAKNI